MPQSTVDHLTAQIDELDRLIARTLEEITTPPGSTSTGDEAAALSARTLPEKLDAVPGIGLATARILLAEIGADTSRFPTLERLVSWAKLCPRTIRSVQREEHLGAGRAGYPLAKGRSR
ncbi:MULTISPECIES: transposase [Streptomyces]|uniref:Transposase IS116/IS110/IS902 C-terminal domain-containing protein n=2 Tax=Streptomyces TaxID=1883 RepID=C9ZA27_STRSW|nr:MULTISPECIES: transposase [Streptomyces]MBE1601572.1 transposase [Streptomyces stelliscabiei]MDX2515110.1 transposase [Streptomyces stelliscabiei]MDX2539877.1 transposase [Streptomyces scabiei]MDX2574691.1 transposase [Streptomyces scabiei]MDX2651693.1 transposase [Streptomyces scabiei]